MCTPVDRTGSLVALSAEAKELARQSPHTHVRPPRLAVGVPLQLQLVRCDAQHARGIDLRLALGLTLSVSAFA